MQDRFKFRYFYNGKIYDVFAVDFMNKTAQLVSLDRKETLFKGIDTDKLIQCTGLKDKNDKLIYEGDVVMFEEIYECACFTNIKEMLFKIVWSDYGFKAKQIKIIQGNRSYESPLTFSKLLEIEPYAEHQTTINLEVIGNIYENPELLE